MNDLDLEQVMNVHYSLWSYKATIQWDERFYSAKLSTNSLYNSVLLPNKNGKKMLWITQPIHDYGTKDDYSSLEIKQELEKGNYCKITWIVDTYNGKFSYVGRVYTNYNPRNDKTSILIQKYLDGIFETVYSNTPSNLKEIYD
jgi:hypothetical protein